MDEGLAPDNKGFNIEGLTARADGKSLLLGLRSPLLGEDFNQAVLIPLENPEGVVERKQQPVLRPSILVNLGGRGVRSIEYSEAARAYFILAGPAGNDMGTFELYKWPAEESDPPTPVPGFSAALQKLSSYSLKHWSWTRPEGRSTCSAMTVIAAITARLRFAASS